MRISEAVAETSEVEVHFGPAVLHVQYRPSSFTMQELEDVDTDKSSRRLIRMIQDMIVGWDLEDNEGEPINIQDAEAVRTKVPAHILTGIIKAVRRHQEPSGEA
jgi:hypothetical protein